MNQRSIIAGKSRPPAAVIRGKRLMDVIPGMVLISFKKISPVILSIRKSTLRKPPGAHGPVGPYGQIPDSRRVSIRHYGGNLQQSAVGIGVLCVIVVELMPPGGITSPGGKASGRAYPITEHSISLPFTAFFNQYLAVVPPCVFNSP